MGRITDTIKHLLIINGIFFLAVNLLGDEVYNWFALHYFQNPRFEFWQPLTHMFMHGSFNHILFNMFGLYMFGSPLESLWGRKKFIFFYLSAGFGAAAEAAAKDLAEGKWHEIEKLRNILEETLEASGKPITFIGKDVSRLPNTSCFSAPGWKGETQVMQMDLAGYAISAGSACSSGKVKSGRVLKSMGYEANISNSAIRVSLGLLTTKIEIQQFATTWLSAYDSFLARRAA